MCLILRQLVSYLRLSTINYSSSLQGHEILFNHHIKSRPLDIVGRTFGTIENSRRIKNGGAMETEEENDITLTTNDDLNNEEDYAYYARYEQKQLLATHQSIQSAFYRPPISLLIDFQIYSLRVLGRLHELQVRGAPSTIDDLLIGPSVPISNTLPLTSPSLHSSHSVLQQTQSTTTFDHKQMLQFLNSSASQTADYLNLSEIHRLMLYLLENGMYVFVQHVEYHLTQLQSIHEYYFNQIPVSQPTSDDVPHSRLFLDRSTAEQPVQPSVSALAANRIAKIMETYREKLSGLVEQYK